MNPLVKGSLAALGFLLVGLCALPAQAQETEEADTITKKDNSKVVGKITAEDLKGVTVTVSKASIQNGWASIKAIDYGGAAEYRKAKQMYDGGAIPDAVVVLDGLRKATALREILKPHVLSMLGACYLRTGDNDKAIEALNDLFAKWPKTQFLVQGGGENLVLAYLAKRDGAGAKAALDKLLGASGDPSLNVLKGRVLEEAGDFAGAAGAYKAVIDGTADDATKAAAELGIGRCLLGQKKSGEAQIKFQSLTSRTELPATVLAGAWNGLGQIAYEEGAAKNDGEKITDALFMFMRGSVLYVPQSGDSTNEYEHALAGSYRCFKTLSEIETKAPAKKSYADRARDRLEALQTKFPNSRWLELQK